MLIDVLCLSDRPQSKSHQDLGVQSRLPRKSQLQSKTFRNEVKTDDASQQELVRDSAELWALPTVRGSCPEKCGFSLNQKPLRGLATQLPLADLSTLREASGHGLL